MKKLSLLLFLMAVTLGSFAADVNQKVLKIFSKTYPEAQSISWSNQEAGGYMVYFTKKDASYRIIYDQDGNVLVALKYYGEDQLSPLVLNKVKKAYPDFKVHSVIEKSSENAVEYHVIIENAKKLITVKSDPWGTLELLTKYDKQ